VWWHRIPHLADGTRLNVMGYDAHWGAGPDETWRERRIKPRRESCVDLNRVCQPVGLWGDGGNRVVLISRTTPHDLLTGPTVYTSVQWNVLQAG